MISASSMKNIYEKSPLWTRRLAGILLKTIPSEILYGKNFRYWRAFLKESQKWSREELEDYQMEQLKKIIEYAYSNVPYYKKVFGECGFQPKDLKSFEDMEKLPFLTREKIRANYRDLISKSYPRSKIVPCSTGGTSGQRLYFSEPADSFLREWAFITTMWERVGFKPSYTRITIGDVPILQKKRGSFWEFDALKREWRFSPFHLSSKNLPKYLEKFKDINCRYIHGFVSSLTIIAKFILDEGISDLPKIHAVLAGSEPIYPWQREILEKAFKARIFTWYGQNEKVILAGECEENFQYHIFPEYGFTEVVNADGSSVVSGREVGQLVGTGFYNYAMPFIRYKLDDWGQVSDGRCSCGRNYKFLTSLEAKRVVNLIVSKHNHLISTTALHLRSGILDNVEKFQFYQEKKGELVLKIVRRRDYTHEDTQKILKALNEQIGDTVDIKIVFVDSIPLTERGKQKILDQRLDIDLQRL